MTRYSFRREQSGKASRSAASARIETCHHCHAFCADIDQAVPEHRRVTLIDFHAVSDQVSAWIQHTMRWLYDLVVIFYSDNKNLHKFHGEQTWHGQY